jgi:plastocyanin
MRVRAIAALFVAGAVIAACSTRQSSGSFVPQSNAMPMTAQLGDDMKIDVLMPKNTVGEELPGEGLGAMHSPFWDATLGGFTQMTYSQALGFPPGTKLTIHNLSKKVSHTLDVIAKINGRPADFPANPKLSMNAEGKGIFGEGYASGVLKPGASVTVTLSKPGTYLIGCYFHYKDGMHDVFVVSSTAKPGQQATPIPKGTSGPTSMPTGGGSGSGW